MKCPYHSDCPNQGTVEVAHGDEEPVKVCLPHLGIYLSNGFTRTGSADLLAALSDLRYTGLEFPPLPPLTLAQRFSRLVAKAERAGVTMRLTIAPTKEYEALRNPRYRQIGDPGDLEEQLNIADAYLAGYGWTKR